MPKLNQAKRKALVLSPAASHPANYGNRRRVFQTTQYFQTHAYDVHFLLYPMEPDWMKRLQESERDMRADWTNVSIIPSSRPLPLQTPPAGDYHAIDEWWDPSIETHLNWLFARESFDVFIVNYAFLSKAFEFAPKETVKILETHDRFSGRKEMLEALGARLESFYTTEEQESRALDRSDIVVAIKDSEAEFYNGLTKKKVVSIPYWIDPGVPELPLPPQAPELRVGFLGALNTINVSNMWSFVRAFEKRQAIRHEAIKIYIAGEVCYHLHEMTAADVVQLGRVESLEDFYASVDLIVAPMEHSTGLKIKVGEALSYGKALVATQNGFDGYPPTDDFHTLPDMEAVCEALAVLARDRDRLLTLQKNSLTAARLARQQVSDSFQSLLEDIDRSARTLVLITDKQIGDASNVDGERLAQWCELCARTGRVVVLSLGQSPSRLRSELNTVDFLTLPDGAASVEAVLGALDGLRRTRDIVEIVLSVKGETGVALWTALRDTFPYITLDSWIPELADAAAQESWQQVTDLWMVKGSNPTQAQGQGLYTVALRYRPSALTGWKTNTPAKGAIVVACGPTVLDQAGIAVLAAAGTPSFPVIIADLIAQQGADAQPDFYKRLRSAPVPEILIAIGADWRGLALCESIATAIGIPLVRYCSDEFPYGVPLHDGGLQLCQTYSDIARHLKEKTSLAKGTPLNRQGEGWETYTKTIIERVRHSGLDALEGHGKS